MMHNTSQSIIVRHREYLAPIKGSVNFQQQRSFPLQPGDSNTFPWLSGLAIKYQQYKIRGMVFHYVPTSGYAVSGSNPAIGSVMIQSSYRAGDNPPTSKVEMLNEYWASEASPADPFCHPIECSPKENPFNIHYVRNVPLADLSVLPLYDVGKTFICTQGMPADGNVVGDLWVTYEIEFSKPQISSDIVATTESAVINYGTPTPASPFGVVQTAVGNLDFTTEVRTLTFPIGVVGRFFIFVSIGSVSNFTAFDWGASPTLTNCSLVQFDNNGTYLRTSLGGTTPTLTRGIVALQVELTDPGATASVLFAAPSWTGTAANICVLVTQVA